MKYSAATAALSAFSFPSFGVQFIYYLIAGLSIHNSLTALAIEPEKRISRYNVIWNTPSKDAAGVMPLGNGDIAAGVYAIENGDLYLLLAKNDAYTYMGDIFKTGRVKISLNPKIGRAHV